MSNRLNQRHCINGEGKNAGGTATGNGIEIRWHDPTAPAVPELPASGAVAPNGALVEDVIGLARGRLEFLNHLQPCEENAGAIELLNRALRHLADRSQRLERERAIAGAQARALSMR